MAAAAVRLEILRQRGLVAMAVVVREAQQPRVVQERLIGAAVAAVQQHQQQQVVQVALES
jgi:hypothetical protein